MRELAAQGPNPLAIDLADRLRRVQAGSPDVRFGRGPVQDAAGSQQMRARARPSPGCRMACGVLDRDRTEEVADIFRADRVGEGDRSGIGLSSAALHFRLDDASLGRCATLSLLPQHPHR